MCIFLFMNLKLCAIFRNKHGCAVLAETTPPVPFNISDRLFYSLPGFVSVSRARFRPRPLFVYFGTRIIASGIRFFRAKTLLCNAARISRQIINRPKFASLRTELSRSKLARLIKRAVAVRQSVGGSVRAAAESLVGAAPRPARRARHATFYATFSI